MACWSSRPIAWIIADAIGRLHARPLQLVVEDRVFVARQVQPRGVRHCLDAQMAAELVRQQTVDIVDGPGENRAQGRQAQLDRNPAPKLIGDRAAVGRDGVDQVDDLLADGQRRDGDEGGDGPQRAVDRNRGAAGFPQDPQDGRDVLQRKEPLPPTRPESGALIAGL